MPFAIVAAVIAVFGLSAREHRVDHDKKQMADAIHARAAAAAHPACQAELARATSDSARIVIVDRCVAGRLQDSASRSQTEAP